MKYREFRWSLLLVLCVALCFCACDKDDEPDGPGGSETQEPEFQPSVSALNVVYFVPTDVKPFEDYQRRLSEIMLWIQDFYRKNMIRNGFGNRSFGLQKETDKLVKVIQIAGERNTEEYGPAFAKSEIDRYFKKHPEEKTSEHVLVIMPSPKKNNMDPGGVPFYGYGKYCFAMDYRYFDIKYLGIPNDEGTLFTKWFGGLAHELGHGLNLPHNSQKVTDEKTLGTALMGSGNYTLGLKPTFLTQASCGILDNCQVFSPVEKEFYTSSKIRPRTIHIAFDEKYIRVNSSYYLDSHTIAGAAVYFDNLPAGGADNEYDAESWYVKPAGADSLSLNIPWSQLHRPKKDFAIRIRVLFPDGNWTETMHEFQYESGKLQDLTENH